MLLIEAGAPDAAALTADGQPLPLAGAQRQPRRRKRWLAAGLMATVVAFAAVPRIPVSVTALVAAVPVIARGCLEAEEASPAIDWSGLLLIGGMLVISAALEKTHPVALAARFLSDHAASLRPTVMLSITVLAASVLTHFRSLPAVAALLVPFAIELARHLHAAPRAFPMTVTFGASACFAMPIGDRTNTLVFSAGGYRFTDFLRVGLPLNVLHWLIASPAIPFFGPLACPLAGALAFRRPLPPDLLERRESTARSDEPTVRRKKARDGDGPPQRSLGRAGKSPAKRPLARSCFRATEFPAVGRLPRRTAKPPGRRPRMPVPRLGRGPQPQPAPRSLVLLHRLLPALRTIRPVPRTPALSGRRVSPPRT